MPHRGRGRVKIKKGMERDRKEKEGGGGEKAEKRREVVYTHRNLQKSWSQGVRFRGRISSTDGSKEYLDIQDSLRHALHTLTAVPNSIHSSTLCRLMK